jgi:parvulin-like peptidyl-prolyl isomerase
MVAVTKSNVRNGLFVALALLVACQSAPPASGPEAGSAAPEQGSAPAEEGTGGNGSGAEAVEEPAIPENSVAAVGGRSVLTLEELQTEVQEAVTRFERLPDREPTNARWRNHRRRQVVLNAVHEQVIEDYVLTQNIAVSDEELDAFVRTEIPHVFDDERLFTRLLESRGVTRDQFMAEKRMELQQDRVLSARGTLEPTAEQVQAHYSENQERWRAEDRALVSTITIRVRRNAPEDQDIAARERVEAIRARIAAGEDFAEIARTDSEGADRSRAGDMGWIERGARPHLAEDGVEGVLFSAPVNEVTDAVRTQLGYQIFLVRDRRDAGVRALDEVQDSIRMMLLRQNRQTLRSALVRELLESAQVQYFEDRWGLEPEEEAVNPPATPVEASAGSGAVVAPE